ncbi:signal peptidase I [Leptotrichia sp.]|jgi:signal peptidase I|uniref:signal peptidase I n=1 Tax=Leptotrichia sp. TaxID=104608 RepID=UPI0017C37A8B|nr:signal peptidase I [Leptotrichia sp.]MBB1534919.1 signal peptidase I [Leptotrichia sp.]
MKKWELRSILRYKNKINKWIRVFWILFVGMVVSYLIFTKLFWFNISPSIPLGIYKEIKIGNISKGDIVVFKMDENFEKYSSTKNILAAKKIVAIYGDKLEIRNNHLFVNGEDYGEYTKGIQKAELKISKNGYWVLSKEKYSLDSRYFGEIKKENILKKVKLVYQIK